MDEQAIEGITSKLAQHPSVEIQQWVKSELKVV